MKAPSKKSYKCCLIYLVILAATVSLGSAWAPHTSNTRSPIIPKKEATLKVEPFLTKPEKPSFDPLQLSETSDGKVKSISNFGGTIGGTAFLVAGGALLVAPSEASAAVAGAPNSLAAAFGAYGHFVSLLGLFGATTYERFSIKPGMTEEDEDKVAIADTMLGVFGFLLAYTGYLRAVELEKGWEYYSHEPIFWVKMTLTAIYGATSFFNTTKIIQRSVARRTGNAPPPMGEALANRMTQLTNVGLLALATIPLSATLMARGVAYNQDFPWQAGAGVAVLALVGLGFKYIKEALEFEDDAVPLVTEVSD
jgi:uncharacterized membrane protein